MAKTVIAVYRDAEAAEAAVEDLLRNDFTRNDISVVARDTREELKVDYESDDPGEGAAAGAGFGAVLGGAAGLLAGLGALTIPGIGPIVAAGPIAAALAGAGIGAAAGGITGALVDWGVPSEDAHIYGESVRRGGILVSVRASDARAQRAAEILEQNSPVDVKRHAETWREREGWTRFDERAGELSRDELTIPIVEEDIRVGKRRTTGAGVRVERYVTETPVEEQVRLRDEHVEVERRRVDRPASDVDFDAFEEGTIEIIEEHEEPVVEKQARVVGEVAVKKEARERVETVTGKERRTDVRVEDLDDTREFRDLDDPGEVAYLGYENEWQRHWQSNYANTGRNFDNYRGAYVYGCRLYDADVGDWNAAEPTARRYWAENYPNQRWEDYRDAVRQGFMVCERR
ncbi:MAG TPA: YsnF/AvaK domain-containing protein [Anaerolineae bacterium]|nr:YsnF/AvaK domain-containing protein [Anaerolineae bacterium]